MTEYRVGDIITVLCMRTSWANSPVAWRPVIGPPHMDEDLQPLTPLHYHVDARFLPNALRGLARPSIVGPIPRVFLTVMNAAWPTNLNVPVSIAALLAGRGGDSSWLRWLKRRVLSQWPAPHFMPRTQAPYLERQYADARVVNGRCPHWGFDLTTLTANADGHRVCPLHGLCWDGDGRLVPRAEQMEVMYTAAEAHEVRRRLREEPADPEFRAWAVTQLAGRLQGPYAPLPAVDSRGLDEQDLVTEEDTAPVPPLPPLQAFAKADTALAAAEAEAARYRDAVAGEHARMASLGYHVRWGETLRPWSWKWEWLQQVWETQQRHRDRTVRDIRVLMVAASAAFGR